MTQSDFTTLELKLPVPCIRGKFGSQLASFTTQISPTDIQNLLGHDPRSKNWSRLPADLQEIYKYLQRKTSKDRRESIAGYIEERLGPDSIAIGAFPAISIALQKPADFRPFSADGATMSAAVGQLMIDLSTSSPRILLDGLGRVSGALDLLDEGHQEQVREFLFPVTIYAPYPGSKDLSWKQMGQLFHDFNYKVHPVTRAHAIALDVSDLYIALANKVGDTSFIRDNGGVAERAASLGKKSTELVVQSVLVRTIRGAMEGRQFQEANLANPGQHPNLTRESFGAARESIVHFFGGLASRMGVRFGERKSIHLTAPGWQALGIIHHDLAFRLYMPHVKREEVLDKLAAVDWSRANPEWFDIKLGDIEVDKMTGQPVTDEAGRPHVALTGAGRTNTQKLIDFMRSKAGYTVTSEVPDEIDQKELAMS
jgi:hypothetical protein